LAVGKKKGGSFKALACSRLQIRRRGAKGKRRGGRNGLYIKGGYKGV